MLLFSIGRRMHSTRLLRAVVPDFQICAACVSAKPSSAYGRQPSDPWHPCGRHIKDPHAERDNARARLGSVAWPKMICIPDFKSPAATKCPPELELCGSRRDRITATSPEE